MSTKSFPDKKVEPVPQSNMQVQSNRFVITRHARANTTIEVDRRNEISKSTGSGNIDKVINNTTEVFDINSPRRSSRQKSKFNISYQPHSNSNSNCNHNRTNHINSINENHNNNNSDINITVNSNFNATSSSSITTTLMNFPSPDSLLSSVIANNTAPLSKSNGSILNSTNGSSFCCAGNRFIITRVPKTTTNLLSTANNNNNIIDVNHERPIGTVNNKNGRKSTSKIVFLETINEEPSTSPAIEEKKTNCSNFDPLIDIF